MKFPMTTGQQGLWFLTQGDPGASAAYNVVLAFRCAAALDVAWLQQALSTVAARHPQLGARTRIDQGLPVFEHVPGRPWQVATRTGDVAAIARAEAAAPFDLADGPLCRVCTVRDDAGGFGLVIAAPHLAFDGASAEIVLQDLASAYGRLARGEVLEPTPADDGAARHVARERAFLSGAANALVEGIAPRLAGLDAGCALPTATTVADRAHHPAAHRRITLAPELVHGVRRFSAACQASPVAVHLAAFRALLWQYGRQDRFCVAMPFDLREEDTARTVGYLANVGLATFADTGGKSLATLVDEAADEIDRLMRERWLSLPLVARALKRSNPALVDALMRVAFGVLHDADGPPSFGDVALEPLAVEAPSTKSLFKLEIVHARDATAVTVEYARDAFHAEVVDEMLAQYVRILQAMLQQPQVALHALPALGPEQARRILVDWNAAASRARASPPVHRQIAAHAAAQPSAPAVVFDGRCITYAQLDEQAARLARRLRRGGVETGDIVAVLARRDHETIVAALAAMKAGAAYLPIDVNLPRDRVELMLDDCAAAALLGPAAALAPFAARARCVIALDREAADADADASEAGLPQTDTEAAYCIYTSGSTGRPKGVLVPHAGLSNLAAWHARAFDARPGDRVMQFANPSFDAAAWEIWSALAAGATLHPFGDAVGSDEELTGFIEQHRITIAFMPTTILEAYCQDHPVLPSSLRWLVAGGDRLHRIDGPAARQVVNAYGPTETVVISVAGWLSEPSPGAMVPIGRPIDGVSAYVLDEGLQPLPVGAVGELHVGGAGVAIGYLGDTELTAQRFIPDPFGAPGARLYRTGDLARWLPDGRLECLGRRDGQVKLRGLRIELGEIEAALQACRGVAAAVVTLVPASGRREAFLAGYVVAQDALAPTVDALRAALRERLPDYMVPAAWSFLDALPLGANGKVDRRALPVPAQAAAAAEPARGQTEQLVAQVWVELIGVESVGRDDDFFLLGGHSLLATRIVARLRERTGRDLSLRTLLDHPTVARMARAIEAAPLASAAARPSPIAALARRAAG